MRKDECTVCGPYSLSARLDMVSDLLEVSIRRIEKPRPNEGYEELCPQTADRLLLIQRMIDEIISTTCVSEDGKIEFVKRFER